MLICLHIIWLLLKCSIRIELWQRQYNPQSLAYLLVGPLQKKIAGFWYIAWDWFIFILSVFWHKLYLYSEKQVEENKILIFNTEIFTVNLMVYNLLVFF